MWSGVRIFTYWTKQMRFFLVVTTVRLDDAIEIPMHKDPATSHWYSMCLFRRKRSSGFQSLIDTLKRQGLVGLKNLGLFKSCTSAVVCYNKRRLQLTMSIRLVKDLDLNIIVLCNTYKSMSLALSYLLCNSLTSHGKSSSEVLVRKHWRVKHLELRKTRRYVLLSKTVF